MEQSWPIQLFNKSVLKQRKVREVSSLLGPLEGRRCLDIGGDNGVVSYMLRQQGGEWSSADLDEATVEAIKQLVGPDVHRIEGVKLPFADDEFDRVAVVDALEHIEDDRAFVEELYRITAPGGELIVNVPHARDTPLRRFQLAIGQTDEKHGHVRHGYTIESLRHVLDGCFTIGTYHTYSRFFSEFIDTVIRGAVSVVKGQDDEGQKGQVVTGEDLSANKSMFRMYSLIYPVVWIFSKLDALLFFASGYMLIAKSTVNK